VNAVTSYALDVCPMPPRVNSRQVFVSSPAKSDGLRGKERVQAVPLRGSIIFITGKTHIGLGLGIAACQKGLSVGYTAAALVHELLEARDEKRSLRLHRQL